MTDKNWTRREAGGLSASAARFISSKTGRSKKDVGNTSWQNEAWGYFQVTPEVRFAAYWIGNAMSGARLFAGKRMPDGTVEEAPEDSRAAKLVSSIAGGPDGQSELLQQYGVHLTVAGEGWTVIIPNPEAQSFADDEWRVLSTKEVRVQQDRMTIELDGEEREIPAGDEEAFDLNSPIAIRVWRSAPWRHIEADSPVRSCLVQLEELQLLNAAVAAVARSRITGRGVVFVPQGTRFPTAPGQDDAADDLLQLFTEVASTAIREPESAAATVPIILEVPADLLGQIQKMTFESDFDELALKLREECIRRFATGLDIPAEILLGQDALNHWAVWAVTAEAIRLGVEPNLKLVCHAYTDFWLRPILESENDPEASEWMVWYDTSNLRTSSNKGATALEAFKLGIISAEAARRETGFEESDAPEFVEEGDPVSETVSSPVSLPVGETESAPDTQPQVTASVFGFPSRADGLAIAVDGVLWAALCQAGNRIMRTPACPRPERGVAVERCGGAVGIHTRYPVTRPEDVDGWKLLAGAWDRVPEIAQRFQVDTQALERALDGYARGLIEARHDYDPADVPRLLRQHAAHLGL